jgi:DNA-binding transcriptional regulator YdaS (Cro superfamily)
MTRRSKAEWEQIVAEHVRLGGTLKKDAALLGVHPVTLQQWTKRLSSAAVRGNGAPARFVPVAGAPSGRVTVRYRDVVVEFESAPLVAWVAELPRDVERYAQVVLDSGQLLLLLEGIDWSRVRRLPDWQRQSTIDKTTQV